MRWKKNTKKLVVCLLLLSWLLTSWPPLWWQPRFPPTISKAQATNFPIIEATNTYQTNSTPTSHAVNLPASIQAGDLLLVVFRAGSTATASIPGDWSLLGSRNSTGVTYVWWKEATGSEGATVTVTSDSSIRAAAISYRISNWSGTPEIAFTGSNTNNPPSLSPSWGEADTLWIAGLTNRRSDSSVTGAPSDYSNLITISQTSSTLTSRSRVSTASRSFTAASNDPEAFSTSGTINSPHSFTIAVEPAAPPAVADELAFQRKTWHDGDRYWRSFFNSDEGRIEFEYSSDGTSWTENTNARISASSSDFSIEAATDNAFVVYSVDNDIRGRKASSYPNTNFSWGSESTVLDGTGLSDNFSYATIARDSANYVWVAARHTGSGVYHVKTLKAASSNVLPQDSSDDVHALANPTNTSPNVYAILNPLANQDMYAVYVENTLIKGCTWDNDDSGGRFEDGDGEICDGTGGGGWLGDWANRLEITVSNSNIDSNLTHFPILLTLGTSVGTNSADVSAIFDELGANSQKIAVTKDDGVSQIYVEIETWDASSEKAWLWVSSSDLTLSSSSPTTLYLYYDNNQSNNSTYVGNTNTSAAEAVWDSNYLAVHHFGATSGTYYDSTSNNNDSSSLSLTARSASASCLAGNCPEFNGSTNHVTLVENNTLDLTSNFTIQLTADHDTYAPSSYPSLVDKNIDTGYSLYSEASSNSLKLDSYGSSTYLYSSTSIISLNTRQNLAITYSSSSTGAFYVNSSSAGGNSSTGPFPTNNDGLIIGNDLPQEYPFDGHIDELRISNTPRSAAWIKADHHSMTDNLVAWTVSEGGPTGSYEVVDTNGGSITQGISSLSNASEVYLAYINGDGQLSFKRRTDAWQAGVVLEENVDNLNPSLALDQDSSDLYVFWVRGSNIYYKQGIANYTESDWDESATTWQASTDNVYLSAGKTSGGNSIFVVWRDAAGLGWDKIELFNTLVSVTITTDGVIEYGVLGNGDTITTLTLADTQTVQNDGNVSIDLNIKTVQPSGWTLSSSPGTDLFVYEFSTNGGGDWIKFSSNDNYQGLASGLAVDASLNLDFRFTAPNPSTSSEEKIITTVIQAVQE